MSVSVASITVAYNAVKVLPRQIDALLRQSRPLREIVVVDNASTDGTAAMLAERYPQVTILRMSENLGQAGGWSVGLSYAVFRKQHAWIWSFDNDTIPEADTLETLLTGVDALGSEVGIAAPLPINGETATCYTPYLWRDGFVKPSKELLCQPMWFADLVIASGCLIRRDVVEKIGLPRSDFFIDLVDFEYCLRARSHGYKIAVISRAKLGHEIGNGRKVDLLGYKRLWINQPPFREYYVSRNLTYLAWRLRPNGATKRSVIRHLVFRMGGVALFSSRKVSCLIRMVQGFHDGIRGRLGIRLRPAADAVQRRGGVPNPAERIEAGKA
jgi:rhamnopyranosyl-N-acetylglucosaminyl-diphospho-decaprenol beta-1,3/1,4-galactofuranosyltransferase